MSPETERAVRAILLDIEGTTTPIDFVYQDLFPYARRHLEEFLARHAGEEAVRADIEQLEQEYRREDGTEDLPAWNDGDPIWSALEYLQWLMAQDRKSMALKSLQGKIWQDGYERGELKGRVFPDVVPALERWTAAGRRVFIFSSGSILAQKLLFSNSEQGDLTRFLSGYFDTTTGPKKDVTSYQRIASAMNELPGDVLFISDVPAELDAARGAPMQTAQSVRPGNPAPADHNHPVIHSFDEIE